MDELSGSGFLHFEQGRFPVLFLLQVQEGMARFEVQGQENLEVLFAYCRQHGYQVEWTRSVPEDEEHQELSGFPGGRYVAHLMTEQFPAQP